jgi:hypothetical protein
VSAARAIGAGLAQAPVVVAADAAPVAAAAAAAVVVDGIGAASAMAARRPVGKTRVKPGRAGGRDEA